MVEDGGEIELCTFAVVQDLDDAFCELSQQITFALKTGNDLPRYVFPCSGFLESDTASFVLGISMKTVYIRTPAHRQPDTLSRQMQYLWIKYDTDNCGCSLSRTANHFTKKIYMSKLPSGSTFHFLG